MAMAQINRKVDPQSFPLVQLRQLKMLEACGFPCAPAGDREFNGQMVAMFQPTGERRAALADVIGYGGAAFGGKTYGKLLLAGVAAALWPGVRIAFFRRTYPELDGPDAAIPKAYEIFSGAATPRDNGKEWTWPNGSVLYFRHCQHEKDVYGYQGDGIDILLFDEATHFTWFIIDYLLTRNRMTKDNPGFRPFALLSSNPGNVGHVWYMQIFDLEKKQGGHEQVKKTQNPNGKWANTYFVPAFLEDNGIGVSRDPGYEERLMQRDPEVARALRYGDWTIFAGQAFSLWMKDRIACAEFDVPDWWPRWRAIDYGFDHPFTCGWFTMNPDTKRVYVYRALLKAGLTDTEQARIIKQMTAPDERIAFTYASPDMWARKTVGTRIFTSVDEYKDEGVPLTRAENDRLDGKRKVDRLLVDMLDELPGIQIFEPYYPVFKCMSTLVRDKNNPEDVEKVDGDDGYDMLRYGLTNLKPAPRKPQGEKPQQNPLKGMNML
jgi:phage terminase large subunit